MPTIKDSLATILSTHLKIVIRGVGGVPSPTVQVQTDTLMVTLPSGAKQYTSDVPSFCRKYDLDETVFKSIVGDKHAVYNGFRAAPYSPMLDGQPKKIRLNLTDTERLVPDGKGYETVAALPKPKKQSTYLVTDAIGHKQTVENLSAFCKEHVLHYACMIAIIDRPNRSYKGYKVTKLEKESK